MFPMVVSINKSLIGVKSNLQKSLKCLCFKKSFIVKCKNINNISPGHFFSSWSIIERMFFTFALTHTSYVTGSGEELRLKRGLLGSITPFSHSRSQRVLHQIHLDRPAILMFYKQRVWPAAG